jgi:hypothetical protein
MEPETLIRSLPILISRSAALLSKGTSGSRVYPAVILALEEPAGQGGVLFISADFHAASSALG